MINVLVVEDDFFQSKQIVNFISKNNEIRLHSMAITGKEALDIINKEEVDLIILDLNLPDMTGLKILEIIEEKKLNIYMESIIIFSGEPELISKISNNPYIFTYINKMEGLSKVNESIIDFIKIKDLAYQEKIIKLKIKKEMNYLCFSLSHKGSVFLLESIYEIYKNKDSCNSNLNKDIYPVVAKKFKTNSHNVKCNIANAKNFMYYECKEEILLDYLGYSEIFKPKTKELIFEILNKIVQTS